MAPPSRLRPHLNDLLQKNLELEHEVADLRHQLTQSSAKWADERKTLATGCDALMASFAKFRARLDVQSSDWGDSEGEVEQNLDAGAQVEETGEVDSGELETEGDPSQGSSTPVDLHERCRSLAVELQVKEEELEESRRKREAAEEELRRVERTLQLQSEQLEAALASAKANAESKVTPAHTADDTSGQANPIKTELETTREKLDGATQEITRLKQLLQQWQKYGNDWKRDAQSARSRISELEQREVELNTQIKAGEDSKALLEKEKSEAQSEVQRLLNALAEQTIAAEFQRSARQDTVKRVHDLEATMARLRKRLSPEQLALVDSEHDQLPEGQSNSNEPPAVTSITAPRPETSPNKRTDLIVLKIPSRFAKKPPAENREPREEHENRATTDQSHSVNQTVQLTERTSPAHSSTDYEVCIHTCNKTLCRNGDRSFLWLRKQSSLPRHALSAKKHLRCNPDCPGHRLLVMSTADATKEPRRARCRPPSDAELAMAAEEAKTARQSESEGEKGAEAEGENGRESSAEPEDREGTEEPEEGSTRDEGSQEKVDEQPSSQKSDASSTLGKRLRSRNTDGDEILRARKLRPRISLKP